MRLIFVIIIVTIAGSSVFSQTYAMRNLTDLSDQYTTEMGKRNLEFADIEGSPYLDEAFVPGEIVINDTIHYTEIPVRYNIYNDRIEFQTSAGQILEIDISGQKTNYKFDTHFFIATDYIDRGKEKKGILEVLVDGRVQLYKQYIIDFKKATETKGYEDAKPNRLVRQDDEYLLAIDQGKPETFRNSKDLMEKLSLINPGIEQYKKSQKLKLRLEQDLIKLIQYCNN